MRLKPYLVPAVIAAALLASVFIAGEVVGAHRRRPSPPPDEWQPDDPVNSTYRMLTVVVDREAYYIGDENVPFGGLRDSLKERARELKANGVVIYGTVSSHFGPAVGVLDTARALHFRRVIPMATPIPDGTRLETIEIRRPWYAAEEEAVPNSAQPTLAPSQR